MSTKNRVTAIVGFLLLAVVLAAYAYETSDGFKATGDVADDTSNAVLEQHDLDFTNTEDNIRMRLGNDSIWMAGGDDQLNMGAGNDKVAFYGDSTSTESIAFDSSENAYIKWTGSDGNTTVRTGGDVVIVLAP